MKVKELIEQLQKVNPEGEVFAAYDSNIVLAKPFVVEQIKTEEDIGSVWFDIKVGDTVLLEER